MTEAGQHPLLLAFAFPRQPSSTRQAGEQRALPPGLAVFACRASADSPGSSQSISTGQHPGVVPLCPAYAWASGMWRKSPRPLVHSYTRPYVSPFRPSAHRVSDKDCETQGQLCGGGGTRARPGSSAHGQPVEAGCSPGQNPPPPSPTHVLALHVPLSGHTGSMRAVHSVNPAVLEADGVWLRES